MIPNNEYLVITVDMDGLVFPHQGYRAGYARTGFQLLMG